MANHSVVIASVLKPVDDTRMFEKIGRSLAKAYEVHIIGYPTHSPTITHKVKNYSFPAFRRISLQRLLSPWKILLLILKIKPSVFLITTHELLIAAVLAKFFCRCKIVYDIQENYFRNILYTKAFPLFIRPFLALYVRMKERVTAPLIDHFLFAERAYAEEMSFIKKRSTIIENKYKPIPDTPSKKTNDGKIHLLFSGTLSENTGVFNAITLAGRLFEAEPQIHLTIIGYCALQREYDLLLKTINNKAFITLIGGNQLVPHAQIIRQINASDYGIIAYPPNRATERSMPTKLYEYLGNKLPILLINNPCWTDYCNIFQASVPFDPNYIDPEKILQKMKETQFYTTVPTDIFWESEEVKLFTILKTLKL